MEGEREQPMFALLVRPNDKLRQDIVNERITAAIVAGYRNYMPDHELILCCHREPWAVLADIVEIKMLRLYGISCRDIEAAGYSTREEMAREFQKYCPNLDQNTPFTVIRWQNVRGKLVDDFKRKEELEHSEDYCT